MQERSIDRALRALRRRVRAPAPLFRLLAAGKQRYECPVCGYHGPFRDEIGRWMTKRNTTCPSCGSTERTRMLWVVLQQVMEGSQGKRAIHFASEPLLASRLRPRFGVYETSSFDGGNADHHTDLRNLPFADASYDILIASHVLEHIREDRQALREIRRVLKPGGIAVIPVPLEVVDTVEYGAPRADKAGHVRAPGLDYYDRYREAFPRVDIVSAADFPSRFHLLSDIVDQPSLGVHLVPVCHA